MKMTCGLRWQDDSFECGGRSVVARGVLYQSPSGTGTRTLEFGSGDAA